LIGEDELAAMAARAYNRTFPEVHYEFLSNDILNKFKGSNYVPISYSVKDSNLKVITLPEFESAWVPKYGDFKYDLVCVTPQDFFRTYQKFFGEPTFCLPLPAFDLFQLIMTEAILEGASDVTFASRKSAFTVYYNVNKRKVFSKRAISAEVSDDMKKLILSKAHAPASYADNISAHGSIDVNENWRGRVEVTNTYWGFTSTIRLLPNKLLNQSLEDLTMKEHAINFIRKRMISLRPGMKLFCGPTMSGKNTTILSALCEIKTHGIKIISVENPVEILTDFVEQIHTETAEQYTEAVTSLIRHNPDLVYITEMTDRTAAETMKIANTGKAVFSTIHSNSVSGTLSRLMDLTRLPLERIVENLDCIFYQLLVPKQCKKCLGVGCPVCYKAGMLPVVEYLELTRDIKKELLGLSLADSVRYINNALEGRTKHDYAQTLVEEGILDPKDFSMLLD
jgi:type II secretory ATPase GspE/PulE/Tfp pilus assembly ATPase PilB-like protein